MKSERRDAIKAHGMGLCVILLIALSPSATAQDSGDNLRAYLELAATDLRARTMEIISGSMNFTEEEGKLFWPTYKEFASELDAVSDQMTEIMKDYEKNVKALSDTKAKELAEKVFAANEQKARINRKYYEKFIKVLPPTRVLQFFQLSHRIDTLVNLRIASILPMIGEDW